MFVHRVAAQLAMIEHATRGSIKDRCCKGQGKAANAGTCVDGNVFSGWWGRGQFHEGRGAGNGRYPKRWEKLSWRWVGYPHPWRWCRVRPGHPWSHGIEGGHVVVNNAT